MTIALPLRAWLRRAQRHRRDRRYAKMVAHIRANCAALQATYDRTVRLIEEARQKVDALQASHAATRARFGAVEHLIPQRENPLMPDAPDFETIAQRLANAAGVSGHGSVTSEIEMALRNVWNARGAADIARLETKLSLLMGPMTAGPYLKNLDRALRTLDR
jgi:hypothetical protein